MRYGGSKMIETLNDFIREFEKITKEYENSVNSGVSSITIHPDLASRMTILKNSL